MGIEKGIKTKLNEKEIKNIKNYIDKYKKIMTLDEFIKLMSGTIINSGNLQVIVGQNCIKFRINCD